MPHSDYPIDVRADYPARSSRGWAALTIFLIKFLALIPHLIVLVALGIAQMMVAFVAQVVVAFKGEYPPGMFAFVTGVLRWSTRVTAFIFSLADRYPPFTLQPDDRYPVDVVVERPAQSSRVYAACTAIVQILFVIGLVWLVVYLAGNAESVSSALSSAAGGSDSSPTSQWYSLNPQGSVSGGLLLRMIAALPHYLVLIALGLVAGIIWLIVQWVILFAAVYPRGMYDIVAGYVRWQTRVSGYSLGLTDRYPPFTLQPSIGGPAEVPAQAAATTIQAVAPAVASATATAPADWYPDPSGRHEFRYWDGAQWTPHVADGGQAGLDPLDGPSAPTSV